MCWLACYFPPNSRVELGPRRRWEQKTAQTWHSESRERVRHLPYAITAFVQRVSHGVIVHIHTEVSICVMSWVEVSDHPRGNSQGPQHCKSRSVWGLGLWQGQCPGIPHYCPPTQQRYLTPKVPVLRAPAKTQHCPYRTGLKPLFFHSLRISTLPFQFLGSRPPV
jgi:hypothetical protein